MTLWRHPAAVLCSACILYSPSLKCDTLNNSFLFQVSWTKRIHWVKDHQFILLRIFDQKWSNNLPTLSRSLIYEWRGCLFCSKLVAIWWFCVPWFCAGIDVHLSFSCLECWERPVLQRFSGRRRAGTHLERTSKGEMGRSVKWWWSEFKALKGALVNN